MAHFPKKIGASFTKGGASVAHFGVQLGAFSKFSSGDTAGEMEVYHPVGPGVAQGLGPALTGVAHNVEVKKMPGKSMTKD